MSRQRIKSDNIYSMPVLNVEKQTAVVKLESIEGGEVTVYTDPTASEMERIIKETGPDGGVSITATLAALIKEWNLTNPVGEPLPVTKENVGALPYKDANKVISAIHLDQSAIAPKG